VLIESHREELLATFLNTGTLQTRDYQRRIVLKTWQEHANGARSVLIHSPTGSGKTVMGLLAARGFQESLGMRIGWIAMRRNLLAQVQRENEAKNLGVNLIPISMFDRNPPVELDLLVVDEAQHDCCNSMMAIHGLVKPKFILGLSATPYRTDKLKLCFDKVIRDAGIHQLIQDGFLSEFHHYTLPDFQPQHVADAYLREPNRWGKSIMYFHTIEDCQVACERLRQGGIRVDLVTGSTDRDVQLEQFSRGSIDVLVNAQVLVEGLDEPTIKTVFVRPSGCAPTIQMAGRVFRKLDSIRYKQVVQCQNTRWPITRTATPAAQFTWLDGQWRSLRANEGIVSISQKTVHALAGIEVNLPRFLNKSKARSRRPRNPLPGLEEIQ